MLKSKKIIDKNEALMKSFVEYIRVRAEEQKCGDAFALGYLESFFAMNMTPKQRKAIQERMKSLPSVAPVPTKAERMAAWACNPESETYWSM